MEDETPEEREQAQELLIENARHGDQQSAHAVMHDDGRDEEEIREGAYGEAESERGDEQPPPG